ncbi:protein of unknown function [Singulisphaera sp. GP187]|uniref:3-keto-disaccharide hydrolase n=1 Tax=Singulisphaera sp. GP187 TaxID=1882752 RepID=UPI000928910A|nr:DUF1080 domain-containing protein [Singulisphaera sp. GP187]SIN71802.1 protein of unknown function [Singulisphaera sp. GP187]
MTTERRSALFLPRRGSLVMAVLAMLMSTMGADQAEKKPDQPTVLFDGKSLDGWKKTDFFRAGLVQVVDGVLVMAPGRAMTGITTTRMDLPTTNYELSYEAKRISGSDFFAAATFPVGKSFVTLVNGGWGGNVTGISSLNGSDASENETNKFVKYENKTWYKFRVRVTDQTIACQVDDKEIIHLDYRGLQLATRIETRPNQPLGFATYESTGALRKIEIRPLTPAEIQAANKTEE